MDDEKRWQDMNADEQAKRITELEVKPHRGA